MTLEDLGYTNTLEVYRQTQNLDSFDIGRVTSEHKDRYVVKTGVEEFDAELLGNLRFTAHDKNDFPAVGDWVAISAYDAGKALIHAVLPRKSILKRKAVGKLGQSQIIATNIDVALIVQSVNRDFSVNRLERYLTICNTSEIESTIILSKSDLIDSVELEQKIDEVKQRIADVPIIAMSNETQMGIDSIKSILNQGKTYCLLGSSGAGKSTLINTLSGTALLSTGAISRSIDRGKHVTSHRELIVLEKGIIIDNPGMREVGITNDSEGLKKTFDEISMLAEQCRFRDCTHTNENGCAVIEAIEAGTLDADAYDNFLKMEKEKNHYESNAMERKKKDKDLGKMIKHIQKQRRNHKY